MWGLDKIIEALQKLPLIPEAHLPRRSAAPGRRKDWSEIRKGGVGTNITDPNAKAPEGLLSQFTSSRPTFMSLYRKGLVELKDIDDYIEQWHCGEDDLPLSEFLGMTSAQYRYWVENNELPENK